MQDNNNYIIKESTLQIRVLAANCLRDKALKYTLGILITFVLTETIANILGVLFPASATGDMTQYGIPADIAAQMPTMPFSAILYTMVVLGAFEFGRTLFQLDHLRNGTFHYDFTFEGFSLFFKTFSVFAIRSIITSVGLMLFIAPGIIAMYYYRQAMFILADDPNKRIIQVLRESRQMMAGNKMSLFRLDFSYVLMYMLAYLPSAIFSYALGNTVIDMVLYTILRLPVYYVLGNLYFSRTIFYEALKFKGFKNFPFKNEQIFRESKF